MADHKASILMGATFVIFTITIGQARNSAAPVPLLILGAAAFFSAVFAVLAILPATRDRKSTRLNSSHANISYAVFCLKNMRSADRTRTTRRTTVLLRDPHRVSRARLSHPSTSPAPGLLSEFPRALHTDLAHPSPLHYP